MPIYKPTKTVINDAAKQLLKGEIVVFPTETVYGIGADATNNNAVAKIFEIKNRPSFNPLIVHTTNINEAMTIGYFNETSKLLAENYWPGPLTIVVPCKENSKISKLVTAGLETVAIRVPNHEIAQSLLTAVGRPIAAPSANLSGKLSPTNAHHVQNSLGQLVKIILDKGACKIGIESTVISCSKHSFNLLRPGAITAKELEQLVGRKLKKINKTADLKAPGMLTNHYAPTLPLRINADSVSTDEALLTFGNKWPTGALNTLNLSEKGDLREAAANLFTMLHELDRSGAKAIAVTTIPNDGLGTAINDRLKRALIK